MLNTKNLIKLANYLDTLPDDYEKFHMGDYLTTDGVEAIDLVRYAKENGSPPCGTVACAVGHGPSAGILFTNEHIRVKYTRVNGIFAEWLVPDWISYCEANFVEVGVDEWEWMFGSGWARHDNTPRGAAARIKFLLAGNDLPDVEDYDGCMRPFSEDHITTETVNTYQEYRANA